MQLLKVDSFDPLDSDKVTQEERQKGIASLIFNTKNHDGTVKARIFAHRRKRMLYTLTEESASLIVATESIYITGVKEINENLPCLTSQGHYYMQKW